MGNNNLIMKLTTIAIAVLILIVLNEAAFRKRKHETKETDAPCRTHDNEGKADCPSGCKWGASKCNDATSSDGFCYATKEHLKNAHSCDCTDEKLDCKGNSVCKWRGTYCEAA